MIEDTKLFGCVRAARLWLLEPSEDAKYAENVVNCPAMIIDTGESLILVHALQLSGQYNPMGLQCSVHVALDTGFDEFRAIADEAVANAGVNSEHLAWHRVTPQKPIMVDFSEILSPPSQYGSHDARFLQSTSVATLYLKQAMDTLKLISRNNIIREFTLTKLDN